MHNKSSEDIEQVTIECSDPTKWNTKALLSNTTTIDEDILEEQLKSKSASWWDGILEKLWKCISSSSPKANII